MRTVSLFPSIVAVCCSMFLLRTAEASDDWLGGFVLGDVVSNEVRTDLVNPGNFFGIPDRSSSLAGLLEGQYQGVTFRVRNQISWKSERPGTSKKTSLQELNRVFQVGENVTLSMGKRLYSLDQSYIGQPLGFFQKQVDLSDPTDSTGRAEGLPMVVLSWADEKSSLTAIYSNDFSSDLDGYNRGLRQWLLRYGYELPNASISIVLRNATGESLGYGGTFSATLGESASVYGSFYTAKGTLRPGLSVAATSGPEVFAAPTDLVGSFRANDKMQYPRASLGVIYTPRDLPKIQLELIYDRRGQSAPQFAQTVGLLHHYSEQLGTQPVARADLAAISSLLQSRGARRKYVSLNADHVVDDWSFGGGLYRSVVDHSGTAYASLGYSFRKGVNLSFSAVRTLGSGDDEFRLSPVASVYSCRLKYSF